MMGYKGMKTIMQEQDKKQIEDAVFHMLRQKEEVLRVIRVAEDAKEELKSLDKKLNSCYMKLVNNSLKE